MAEKLPKAKLTKTGKRKTSIQVEEVTLKRMKTLAKRERRTVSGVVENLVQQRYAATEGAGK